MKRGAIFLLGLVLAAQTGSTRRMAARLAQIYQDQDWKTDPNKAADRVKYYQSMLLLKKLDLRTELRARIDMAEHMLVAGDSAGSAEELEKLRRFAAEKGIILNPAFDRELRQNLALAYLRLGEQQNCIGNHNADSCVYPLRGGAIHTNTRGAEGAVREYTALLELNPKDLTSRWLLNIAYMALGRPTPERWRISEHILDSEYDIGRFKDAAGGAGVAITRHAGGVVAEDFDGDGLFDLMVSSSGPADQLRYFHNNGDGTFSDQTEAAGLTGETGGLNLIHADYNNDGHPDVVVLRGGWWGKHGKYPFSLLRNNGPDAHGQITFTDVTEAAFGTLSLHPTQTAAWADYDNDGWLDLYVGHEASREEAHPSELWHNNHDGTFTNVAPQAGLADMGYVKGVAWGDFNNDGRPDLYISRKGSLNSLYRNDGDGKFTDVTRQAGVGEPVHSFTTWFFDYDNDGWLDLFVAGYYTDTLDDIPAFHLGLPNKAETPRLYHNNRDGTFTEVSKAMGIDRAILIMGAGCGDLDNDGWIDCYLATGAPEYETLLPNRMFRNDNGRRFQDVTKSGGFGQLQKGHAVAFADFDRDGDQDVFEVLGGAYPGDTYMSVLLENPGHGNHWLGLQLEGTKSNRSAIGARVRIQTALQTVNRVVQPGTSFGDAPLELHVGLGKSKEVRDVEVRWPSGLVEHVRCAADSVYRVREGNGKAERRDIQPHPFRHESSTHQH